MDNFTILKNIPLPSNNDSEHDSQQECADIQDIIKLSDTTLLYYSNRDIGILKNFKLTKVYKNVLPHNEQIKQVESIYKDLIAVSSSNRILIISTLTGRRVKDLQFPEVEITNFLVQDKQTLLIAHKHYILKVNIFNGLSNRNDHILHRTKLDQPICKIHRKSANEILIQTFYENIHVLNLETKQTTKYYYYDLPSRLFTDALIFKNDIVLSYSRNHSQINRMNIRNGSNSYIDNEMQIYSVKKFENEEEKYLVASFNNGKISVFERKSQKEVGVYLDESMCKQRHAIFPLKDNQVLVVNPKCARVVELEIVERNYCTFF